jgi:hypothetical protein
VRIFCKGSAVSLQKQCTLFAKALHSLWPDTALSLGGQRTLTRRTLHSPYPFGIYQTSALVYTKWMFCYIVFEFVGAGKMDFACTCAGLEAGGKGKRLYETGRKIQNRFHNASESQAVCLCLQSKMLKT